MALIPLSGWKEKLNQIRRFLLYGKRADPKKYIALLRERGAVIGEDLYLQSPETIWIDDTSDYMLTIGDHVTVATGVTILTHDGCWHNMKTETGKIAGHVAPVTIGNHVFLGINSTVVAGTVIGDHVILGANSVASGRLLEPGVYSGIPARLIQTAEEYEARLDRRQLKEAYQVGKHYYERFGVKPPQDIFWEYFVLFCPRKREEIPEAFLRQMRVRGNFEQSMEWFLKQPAQFASYDAFWGWCEEEMKKEKERCQEQKK